MIWMSLIAMVFLLAGCEEIQTPTLESSTRFYAVTDEGFVEFVYKDGKFEVRRVSEFEDMYDPEGFTTDGTHLVAWDGHSIELADSDSWNMASHYYDMEEYVKYAVTDGDYVYTAGYEEGVFIYKRGNGLERTGSVLYHGAEKLRIRRLWIVGKDLILAKSLFSNTFYVIDVEDRSNPRIVKVFEHPYTWEVSGVYKPSTIRFVYTTTTYYPVVYDMWFTEGASPSVETIFEGNTDFTNPAFLNESVLVDHMGRVVSATSGELLTDIDVEGYPIVYENKVFLVNGTKIRIFDISNPSSPDFLTEYSLNLNRAPWIFSMVFR